MVEFAHLHVHSEYSLLDGSAKIAELPLRVKKMGMTSLALTDHGTMYGAIDFYKACKAEGIKPIMGCEVYVADVSIPNKDKSYTHLVLLAEDEKGYRNLIKLVSLGFTEGFYYKPRVDIGLLREYSSGLIALSACMAGAVPRAILSGNLKKAKDMALLYDDIFGRGNFFLELQNHGIADQKTVAKSLVELSQETGIPLVATNDVHYISKDDAQAHDVLLCIQTNKTITDQDRMRYEGDQFYLKSPKEMYDLFSYAPEAIENTKRIADRCNVEIVFNEYKLPKYQLPPQAESFSYLSNLCEEGLIFRYGEEESKRHRGRMEFELNTIRDMGFVDYFLIVWDFIKYARDNGIIVGPGRGSAAGSIVSYTLRITDVDPIPFGLMFERFLNPERISMPDIDIDFCYERRQEVIDYVVEKYGTAYVAQIITFGTMAARAAIRDVGRAMAMPYVDVDRVAKMIPTELGITLKRGLELNPELKKAYLEEDDTKELLDMSMRLEGLPRHASTHAAGVVICDAPVDTYVPLYQNDGLTTTQFSMNTLEELGLLKMDFLGLRTLTVIQSAMQEIKRGHGIAINWDEVPYDDSEVYKMISQGKTEGVFQLESSGMKAFIKELQPESLEDIIAGIALFRPGPMEFIPKYIRGRHSKGAITYTHPALEPILSETYGCIVYQEQVMQIVRELAGYSLAQSDLVRRAMSKKKGDVMAKEREHFIVGCAERGIDGSAANRIFDEMSDFAKYAFNKSHAAAYAVIGYQTAWLKKHYPVEFMAAIMTSVMDHTPKVVEYIQVCKKMGIPILPPDVNEGYSHFTCSGKSVRFGLSAIKNVGRAAIETLVVEREKNGPYLGMADFIRRVIDINSRFVEGLIKAGAFDSLGGSRAQYMQAYKGIMDGVANARKQVLEGQMNLFELDGQKMPTHDELPFATTDKRIMLNDEKEALGLYISGHPLSDYEDILKKHTNTTSIIADKSDRQKVSYGGLITGKSIKYTRASGKPMAFITVEDVYGAVDVIVFSKLYEECGPRLIIGQVVLIEGQVSLREDEDPKIVADNIRFYAPTFWIKLPQDRQVDIVTVADILKAFPGGTKVKIYDEGQKKKFVLEGGVDPNTLLFEKLGDLLGPDMVKLV